MRISLQKASDAAYEAAFARAAEATFYHTRAWAKILTDVFPSLEDRSGLLTTVDGDHVLPAFVWRRAGGLLRTHHSSFPFLYGGPIPSTESAWRAASAYFSTLPGSARLTGNPFAKSAPSGSPHEPPAPRGFECGLETTHLLSLPASAEIYWETVLTTQKRNDVRRLSKKGVIVETSRDPRDIRAVYEMYRRRMATWSQRPGIIYPLKLYEEMMGQADDEVRLYVARFEERLIGGTFVCRHNGVVHYHAGYFDNEARRLRPNVLVQERIIRDAIEDGYRIYDMLPSAGIASVEAFKESFGGVRTTFPVWSKTGTLHRLAGLLRR